MAINALKKIYDEIHYEENEKYINISGFKKEVDLLSKCPSIVVVEWLSIVQGDIQNLDFLITYKNLKKLELYGMRKLTDISGLVNVKNTLVRLEIESCKNIKNVLETVCQMDNLKELNLINFTFDNLDWVKNLPQLEHLSLSCSNVISGDLSPVLFINHVGIDNKRHYNYKYDWKTRKLIPKKVQTSLNKSTYKLPYFDSIDLKSLESEYESSLYYGDKSINISLHFEKSSSSKAKLKLVKTLLTNIEAVVPEILTILKGDFEQEGATYEYVDFINDEADEDIFSIVKSNFGSSFELKSILFCPEMDDYAVFDFILTGFDLEYVLSVKLNKDGQVVYVAMEN